MKHAAWLIPLAIATLLVGATRLQLDADIFNLLPKDSPIVRSLQLYQQDFGASNELVLLLRSPAAATSAAAAERIAADLATTGLAARVTWRNPIEGDPDEMAELLAYLWFNQPPASFAELADRFAATRVATTLERTLDRMAVSFQPAEVARLAADPFNIGDIAQRISLPVPRAGQDPFASADGATRLVVVAAPDDAAGFFPLRAWVREISAWVDAWRAAEPDRADITIGITGNPSFVAESGSSLLRDVLSAAGGTLIIVALLFWLVHRRWRPLLWLVALLTGVLATTALAGGWLFGTLHAISLGFAAILLGLAADYGLILYQEQLAHPNGRPRDHRAAVAPAILWSTVTTAGAFFMIARSSLPGLTQLGVLVGIGILIAAVVMLVAYLPLAGAQLAVTRDASAPPRAFRLPQVQALGLTALVIGATLVVLIQRQPAVDSDARSLALNSGESRAVLDDVRREIGGFDEDLWLIVTGSDESEVRAGLDAAAPLLDAAVDAAALDGYQLPVALWPAPARQQRNRATLDRLVERWPAARRAAADAGFADDALRLSAATFAAWQRFRDDAATAWPETPGASWVMRQFAVRQDGRMAALGRLQAPPGSGPDGLRDLDAALVAADAGQLASWTLLAESLLGVMDRDVERVLIPMTVALLILLVAAFRSIGEVALSLLSMALSLGILLALMVVLGWSWNLMNVMALPMLFGAGVDYGLHIQFALRRYAGDAVRVRNTVGRAILLCAASTAGGFATLGFASNAGVASLGKVCATGIVVTSLVSVFLLPAWWRIMARPQAMATTAT